MYVCSVSVCVCLVRRTRTMADLNVKRPMGDVIKRKAHSLGPLDVNDADSQYPDDDE